MIKQLQKLLTEVNNVCIKVEQERKDKESRGEYYNVFNVLGLWSEEVKLHSAFIAELLNPKGSHGLGGSFLKAFLKQANLSEDYINVNNVESNIVERNVGDINDEGTEGGRIDIIIEDGSCALIIENKIYAGDQYKQLLRYSNYAKDKFKNYEIIYLTLDGHEADENSTNKEVTYICMSYREGIIDWLTECAKLAFAHPLVRETINQYIQLLKQLTNITMDENHINQVAELASQQQNVDSTLALLEAQYKIKQIFRERYIFEPLKKYAEAKGLAFELGDYTLKFQLTERDGGCIAITTDASRPPSWTKMYIGITYDIEKETQPRLECLESSPGTLWPYGWQWVNIDDWESPDTLRVIKDGKVANWIMGKIDEILDELKKRKIEL